jgi:hypothetical protein
VSAHSLLRRKSRIRSCGSATRKTPKGGRFAARGRRESTVIQPQYGVVDVHRRERPEVGLGAVGMFVGTEPERLHGVHAELTRTSYVLVEAVADEDRGVRFDVERVERTQEDRRIGFAPPYLGREHGKVDTLRDSGVRKIAVQQSRRIERVGDDCKLQALSAE